MRVAAIDVGTNTTRLLVAEATGDGYRELDRQLRFTRLGAGVDSEGKISSSSLRRTLAAVADFCALCGEYGVETIRAAGTSAVRDASNRSAVLEGISVLTGREPEVLSGSDEARLTFLGATGDVHAPACLVVDIGGGSTEFVHGAPRREPDGSLSLDIGSVRLTELYLHSDPPATEEMLTMEAAIDDALAEIPTAESLSDSLLIGVAGTVTSLAALHKGLTQYDPSETQGSRLTRAEVDRLYRRLAAMTTQERKKEPSLPEGRADVIVAGAAILSRTLAFSGFEDVVVSERDILDGLVLDML